MIVDSILTIVHRFRHYRHPPPLRIPYQRSNNQLSPATSTQSILALRCIMRTGPTSLMAWTYGNQVRHLFLLRLKAEHTVRTNSTKINPIHMNANSACNTTTTRTTKSYPHYIIIHNIMWRNLHNLTINDHLLVPCSKTNKASMLFPSTLSLHWVVTGLSCTPHRYSKKAPFRPC